MIKDLPKNLINAVNEINKISREKYFNDLKIMNEKMAMKKIKMPASTEPKADPAAHSGASSMAKVEAVGSEGSHPRTPKEKKLAAMTHPKNKITHGDILHGRGVRREGFDDLMKAAKERRAAEGTGKFDKRTTGTGTVYTRKSSTFDDGGKDADMKKAEKKMKNEAGEPMSRAAQGHEKYGKEGMLALAKAGREGKALDPIRKKFNKYEELEIKEVKDTPGNSTHQCAIHVKSEQFGEGRTLTGQHAEPDSDGYIAWYDVMFTEGIKRVHTEDIEVLVSEMHMNHKKKKGM